MEYQWDWFKQEDCALVSDKLLHRSLILMSKVDWQVLMLDADKLTQVDVSEIPKIFVTDCGAKNLERLSL